ncbi:odorant receptor 42a-like [Musca vetustissima]|uniref:odorant receptor 42a-like n=1 Tax=Musca vetustissima TaxID=27455 RepID=UPI002AB6E665|nr:odorant receptor 42a-like [Musca vetustissima]
MVNREIAVKPKKKVATKHAVTYLYGCFHIMGIHPGKTNPQLYILYALVIHTMTTIFTPISFTTSYFIRSDTDTFNVGVFLTSVQAVINVYGCAVKMLLLVYYKSKLEAAEKLMDKMDEHCRAEDEVQELYTVRNLGRRIVLGYCTAYWIYTTMTYIAALISGVPSYSLNLFVIQWRRSKWEFYVASFIEYILTSWTCFQQVANDSYGTVYVCILRAHVRILLLRIRKMCSQSDQTAEQNLEELKSVIKDHKDLIQLYNAISPVISQTIFLQFSITAIILGITLINIAIFSTTIAAVAASSFYVIAVVVEIFPLCYYANCLLYDSDTLATEIFHSAWIDRDQRYRKMLIFFIQRTQKSMELWAGKMFPINLNSFISIAKFSFSLYTLIKQMGIKERLDL